MIKPTSPFEQGLKLMGAQQQLATRSLLNMIEMVSTSSHRYARETSAFAEDAVRLMQEASHTRNPQTLSELQKEWARTCVKYSQKQTRATMQFVEQCGVQALNTAADVKGMVEGQLPPKDAADTSDDTP